MSACCSSGTHSNRRPALDVSVHQACNTGIVRLAAEGRPERSVLRKSRDTTMRLCALFLLLSVSVSGETIQGRWKLVSAEDLRADGSVGRYPWGRHPVGSIVVEGGACYLQIMSSDVPSFAAGATSIGEQMK